MAYAALVSLSRTIQEIHHHDHYSVSWREKRLITFIQNRTIFLKGFLEDFPKNANSLEERIRDAADEAEDIIEKFMWSQILGRNHTRKWIAAACESIKPWLSFDLRKLKILTKEINSIAREAMEMKNSDEVQDSQLSDASCVATSSSSSSRPVIAPTGKDIPMIGFEDDLMEIKSRLCGESSKLCVIPIIGMGGIGKTTLARNAYDDPLTVERFPIRAWVTVSQHYSATEILSSLLVSTGAKNSDQSNNSEMEVNVHKTLKGRRYLVALDDMWSTQAWDDVRRILPDDHNGSRIMLTTRLLDVATYPDSSSPLHKMQFMDPDESWNLLRQKVDCPPELEDIGKEIAKNCRGLPLAIVLIAGSLSTVNEDRASWENIARNVNEVVTGNQEQFAEIILSSSYDNLPHHLRPCFLYMGCFPEDCEIRVSRLIKLWVAEGFLKLKNGGKSCEEEAEEYLEALVKRSLALVARRKSNDKIKSCKIHDMVRDLCIRKSHEEKFFLKVGNGLDSMQNQRRLIIENSDPDNLEYIDGRRIHTIIRFQQRGDKGLLIPLANSSFLRVLEMVHYYISSRAKETTLPNEIFELSCLTHLSIDFPTEIPAAISQLKNLQTLIIDPRNVTRRDFFHFQEWTSEKPVVYLPGEIWRMPQLRHLIAFPNFCLGEPQEKACALVNLQTLSLSNFVCSKSTVKMIPNLKKLGIYYLGTQINRSFYPGNLVHLDHLEKIRLDAQYCFINLQGFNHIFPTTLRKLTLAGLSLPWKDMGTLVGSLPNLEVLKLSNWARGGNTWETRDGEFCQLKFLLIEDSPLEQWITESSHFPSLKRLVLHWCSRLKEIPDGIGEIPTLEIIEIDELNISLVDSAKRMQEEQQQNCGNDDLKVHVTPVWKKVTAPLLPRYLQPAVTKESERRRNYDFMGKILERT